MSLPPAAIAVLVLDLCAWALLLPAGWASLRLLASWDPSSSQGGQLALEQRAEQSSLLGRIAVALLGLSSLVLLVALLVTLPRVVPGAMCAAGVLEALPGGRTMVGLRVGTLLAAVVWSRLDTLNRGEPLAPLTEGAARALLVLVAIAAVASWRTAEALFGLELDRTVSCCTILYDLAAGQGNAAGGAWLSGPSAAAGTAASALAMALLSLALGRRASRRLRPSLARAREGAPEGALDRTLLFALLGAATVAWALLGAKALVDWTGPYLFGALGHRCPFCLFLPLHHGYGWWAWGAIALGARESVAMITTEVAARRAPSLRRLADRRHARAGPWLAVVALGLCALLVGPVIAWRSSTGVDLLGRHDHPRDATWVASAAR